jgi:hypothetical protein
LREPARDAGLQSLVDQIRLRGHGSAN